MVRCRRTHSDHSYWNFYIDSFSFVSRQLDEGSGSYGTVHFCKFDDPSDINYIAKRSWTLEELVSKQETKPSSDDLDALRNRAERCKYYIKVEEHCLEKIKKQSSEPPSELPKLIGRFVDNSESEHEWLVFEPVLSLEGDIGDNGRENTFNVAKTLKDVMDLDWKDQHEAQEENSNHHHLFMIQKKMGLPESATFEDTLDVVMKQLLKVLVETHKMNIVHRDIKPENLLIDGHSQSFVLIDFGSAADMDPIKAKNVFSFGSRVGLEDESRVAVSPVYSAPEIFVKWDKSPLEFDVFSVGLIFCQLLFNLLDERTDAAFRQQVIEANCDLDIWLERSLAATFRPTLDEGLSYLAERPGVWSLLKDMLVANPARRISSFQALDRFTTTLSNLQEGIDMSREEFDGSYFDGVISALETCLIPDIVELDTEVAAKTSLIPRPLHFIATFKREESLGLVLSEFDIDGNYEEELSEQDQYIWDLATMDSNQGEVFVRGIVDDGQASEIGVFEIGDKVVGVSDFPLLDGGFEEVLNMLKRVPQRSKTVKIHFDRRLINNVNSKQSKVTKHLQISSQGAWSTKGRRKTQEDRFLLHEVKTPEESRILAGIFDGHGGSSAAETAAQLMPHLYRSELQSGTNKGNVVTADALQTAWDSVCDAYREGCSIHGGCVAEYDTREGILFARTGAKDLIAGTTATLITMSLASEQNDELVIMNCGDSRALVVGYLDENPKSSVIHFVTRDHSPSDKIEAERLRTGKESGLDYSQPQCSVNRWWLKVGDYQYAVCRSLEGPYATSKGIISKADITSLNLSEVAGERSSPSLIVASDGLFEVLDNEEVGREVLKLRSKGMSANEIARQLCEKAVQKSSSDNVSVIIIFLE